MLQREHKYLRLKKIIRKHAYCVRNQEHPLSQSSLATDSEKNIIWHKIALFAQVMAMDQLIQNAQTKSYSTLSGIITFFILMCT